MVGSATEAMSPAGPPAPTIARWISADGRVRDPRADGWALKTTALPAEMIEIALLMTVAAGLVTGEIEPTTPNGANSVIVMPPAPETAWTSRSSGPGVFVEQRRFLVVLSSTRPRPVSSTASRASASACSSVAAPDRLDDHLAPVQVQARPRNAAALAAATASSSVAKTPSPSRPAAGASSSARTAAWRASWGPGSPTRRRTRSMMSVISRSSMALLAVDLGAAELPRVHDRHDHGVARAVPRDLGLARGAAATRTARPRRRRRPPCPRPPRSRRWACCPRRAAARRAAATPP